MAYKKTTILDLVREGVFTRMGRLGMVMVTLIFFLTMIVLDGNLGSFVVKEAYLPILETILVTMVIALFTSKGGEYIMKTIHENKVKKLEVEERNLKIELDRDKIKHGLPEDDGL